MTRKLVHGIGINDSDYKVQPTLNGVKVYCPYYTTWVGILQRSYSEKFKSRCPTYQGCSVVPEWHKFTTFRSWMLTQDWEGKQLDKDLLVEGNKVYGPDTCIFVSKQVNMFITTKPSRGKLPVGVRLEKTTGRYAAQCHELSKGVRHLGQFDCPNEAHKVYMLYKQKQAEELASMQTDNRVSNAILSRYPKLMK